MLGHRSFWLESVCLRGGVWIGIGRYPCVVGWCVEEAGLGNIVGIGIWYAKIRHGLLSEVVEMCNDASAGRGNSWSSRRGLFFAPIVVSVVLLLRSNYCKVTPEHCVTQAGSVELRNAWQRIGSSEAATVTARCMKISGKISDHSQAPLHRAVRERTELCDIYYVRAAAEARRA